MQTRQLTQMDRETRGMHDYFVFRINPVRMGVEDVDRLRQKIEDTINLELGRDAVRVEARIRRD